MSYAHYIKEIGRADNEGGLTEEDACQMFGAMLDGGVPELELGAILLALRMKSESLSEMLGFHAALNERLFRLRVPAGTVLPVVFPSYGGAFDQPNLLPLLALLLRHFGVPVLVHGALNGDGGIASAYIFRELGIMPCANLNQAQEAIDSAGIAFVPTAVLAPGLAEMLRLRGRLGLRTSAHSVAKLIDPFESASLRIVSTSHPPYLEKLREFLLATGARALLLRSTEGEAFADPVRRPQLVYFNEGTSRVLFEAEVGTPKAMPALISGVDAVSTAAWIRQALAGEAQIPLPLVNQVACCLFGAGYTVDMAQAKAIVAVETGSLAAA
jgi:anthranilate phosphoribosyltransferase